MQKLPDLAGHGALTLVFVLRQYLRYLKADAAERPAIARAIVRSLKNTLTQGHGKKLQVHFLMLMDFWMRTNALKLTTDRPSPAQHGDGGEAQCLGCERLSAAAAAANGGGGGAVAASATSVRAALRNFEQFHGRAPGTATVDEVEASSAGVAGWAEGAATTASCETTTASCETCRPDNPNGFQATAKCAFLAHLNYLEPQIVCFTDAVYRSNLFLDLAAECIIHGDTFDNDENTDKYEKSRLSKMLELLSIFLFRRPLSPGLDTDAAREATKGACVVELNLDNADNVRARAAMADYNACVVATTPTLLTPLRALRKRTTSKHVFRELKTNTMQARCLSGLLHRHRAEAAKGRASTGTGTGTGTCCNPGCATAVGSCVQ